MQLHAELGLWKEPDQRVAQRRLTYLRANLRPLGARGGSVIVHDLSTHGFSVKTDAPLPPGTFVWLRFEGTNGFNAQVVWAEGRSHGCEFLVPISQEQYRAAINSGRVGAA